MVDGNAAFRLAYEVAPITLSGGIASDMPGGIMPLLSFTDALSFGNGILSPPTINISLETPFATFMPLPGSTLIAQRIGNYPFANQYVAANAVIFDPLNISMLMICPCKHPGDYYYKTQVMTALQATLMQHNQSGGLYNIATPSFLYANLVMLMMTDVSTRESKQVQNTYKLDFTQPLVTQDQADAAQNGLMSQIGSGVPTDGSQSGGLQSVGNAQPGTGTSVVSGAGSSSSGSVGPFGMIGPT